MSHRLRNISLALLAGSALVVAGASPIPFGIFGSQPALAQGNSGSHGGGNSGGNANSHSGGGNSQASDAPGKSDVSTGVAAAGGQDAGTPNALIRKYVLETGLKQGDVARMLKSWNSLNRNPIAFQNNVNNLKSLPGLQVAYIRDNMLAQTQLAAFVALGGDPTNPPTAQQVQDAQAYLSAQASLTAAGVDAGTVLADPTSYDPALVEAANTVTNYTGADAQTVVDQYNAWTTYQTAEATAVDAFQAASVSYRNADPATLDALRTLVDDIVTTQGLDTTVSSF